jgi:4-hydroxybenzoate polyprenyltransferase
MERPSIMVERGFTDIRAGGWIDRLLPAAWRPYARLARLDRPIGWELLLYPCWWSLALAAPGHPDPRLAVLFLTGAIAMRGAGCAFNDIVDRDFDARVERTRSRPIPSGQVSVRRAALFTALLLAIGAGVLLSLDPLAIFLGLGILFIVVLYPFMKRVTYWPQIFLGLNFNWGAVIAWAAATGHLAPAAFALYAGGIAWTLFYDTIYAHSDKADDRSQIDGTAFRRREQNLAHGLRHARPALLRHGACLRRSAVPELPLPLRRGAAYCLAAPGLAAR